MPKSDSDRITYLLTIDIFDGFVDVQKDRYEYAMDVAKENGRDEPTFEDELEGFRRMIDCSMVGGDK